MKVVASAIVDKYIGESARVIREMFGELGVHSGDVCLSRHISSRIYFRLNFKPSPLYILFFPSFQDMQRIINPASSLWTKSTPSEAADFHKGLQQIVKFKERSWR